MPHFESNGATTKNKFYASTHYISHPRPVYDNDIVRFVELRNFGETQNKTVPDRLLIDTGIANNTSPLNT